MTMLRHLLLALLSLVGGLPAAASELTVEMLDVGQGDGILISSDAGKRVLIDAGTRRADVLGQLRSRGVERLDLVVATHPHADHIGGMAEVLRGLDIGFYTDSGQVHTTRTYNDVMDAVEEKGIRYRPAEREQTFGLGDDARLSVLFPDPPFLRGTRSDLNSNSVVIRLDHGDNCFLFTGDSEEPTEAELMRNGLEQCDVLKVAHHGSSHSSSDAWLRAVQPSIALISAGVDNRYGHPAADCLERLESAGVQVYRTDLMGAVVVHSDGKELSVETRGKEATVSGGPALASAAIGPRSQPSAGPGRHKPTAASVVASHASRDSTAANGTAAESTAAESTAADSTAADKPTTTTNNTATAAASTDACAYVASRNSRLYHPAGCHVVDRIYQANRLCFDSVDAARASGRKRSASCPELGP